MTGQLEQFQRDFAAALTAGDPKAWPKSLDAVAGDRFRIYRNNYFASLAKRLAEVFPATMTAIGKDAFHHIVYCYAAANPPKARSLACFGGEFSTYLKRQVGIQPAFAIDLAALEFACHAALHSPDARVLDPGQVVKLGGKVTEASFKMHPAARIVKSSHPVLRFWRTYSSSPKIDFNAVKKTPETILVTRPESVVMTTRLSPGEALFLETLGQGKTARTAAAQAEGGNCDLDLEVSFAKLLAAGVFRAVTPGK